MCQEDWGQTDKKQKLVSVFINGGCPQKVGPRSRVGLPTFRNPIMEILTGVPSWVLVDS